MAQCAASRLRFDTLKQVIESERDPLIKALNAFLRAGTLPQLPPASPDSTPVTPHEAETENSITAMITQFEQDRNLEIAETSRLRLRILQSIRKQREMATSNSSLGRQDYLDDGYEEHGRKNFGLLKGALLLRKSVSSTRLMLRTTIRL